MISGSNPINTAEPAMQTPAESRNPGFERSIKYHRKGLTSASVMDTCIVEAQGSFLCREKETSIRVFCRHDSRGTYNSEDNTGKGTDTSNHESPISVCVLFLVVLIIVAWRLLLP